MYRDRIVGLKEVSVSKLVGFSGGNPKKHTDDDRSLLEASLDNHGYVIPIAVRKLDNGTYETIDGHHRVDVIIEHDPEARIKVLVLDVDSVAEGRRILLALQHTSDWDVKKLETFVEDALADGVTAEQVMADTGMGGDELDALAKASRDFLEGVSGAGEDDDEIDEHPSHAGLNPEHVAFSVEVTREQSKVIRAAIKLAKQVTGVTVHADALVEICEDYARNNKKPSKKKTKSKKK